MKIVKMRLKMKPEVKNIIPRHHPYGLLSDNLERSKDSIAAVLILVGKDGGMYFDNCGIEARDVLWALRKMEQKLLREDD